MDITTISNPFLWFWNFTEIILLRLWNMYSKSTMEQVYTHNSSLLIFRKFSLAKHRKIYLFSCLYSALQKIVPDYVYMLLRIILLTIEPKTQCWWMTSYSSMNFIIVSNLRQIQYSNKWQGVGRNCLVLVNDFLVDVEWIRYTNYSAMFLTPYGIGNPSFWMTDFVTVLGLDQINYASVAA